MGTLCARCLAPVEAPDDGDPVVCDACRAKEAKAAGSALADHDSSVHDLASLMKPPRLRSGEKESSSSTNRAERTIDADLLQLPTASFAASPEPEQSAEDPPARPSAADEEIWFAAGDMTPIDDELAASQPPPPRPAGDTPSIAPAAAPSVAPLPAEPPRPWARRAMIVRSYLPTKVGPWAGAAVVALLGLGWLAVRAAPSGPSDVATAPSSVQPEATAVVQAAAPATPEPAPAPEPAAAQPTAQAAAEIPEPASQGDDPATAPAAAGKTQRAAAVRKPFNRAAANAALSSAAARATACRKPGEPKGMARVTVTFAPTGGASQVQVAPPFSGTKSGACVAGVFRTVSVPAFDGPAVPAAKGVSLR